MDSLRTRDLLSYYTKFKSRLIQEGSDENLSSEEIILRTASTLRNQNKKAFTIRKISSLTGISTGKLSQELRKRGEYIG